MPIADYCRPSYVNIGRIEYQRLQAQDNEKQRLHTQLVHAISTGDNPTDIGQIGGCEAMVNALVVQRNVAQAELRLARERAEAAGLKLAIARGLLHRLPPLSAEPPAHLTGGKFYCVATAPTLTPELRYTSLTAAQDKVKALRLPEAYILQSVQHVSIVPPAPVQPTLKITNL